MDILANKDLIKELQKMNLESKVVVFAEGKIYPALAVQKIDKHTIEIGCGWGEMEEDECY